MTIQVAITWKKYLATFLVRKVNAKYSAARLSVQSIQRILLCKYSIQQIFAPD